MISEAKRQIFSTMIEDLLRDLDAGIRYYEIYPTTHPLVSQITDKVYFQLIKIIQDFSSEINFLNISVYDEQLFANHIPLQETFKSQLFRKFRDTFKEKNISNVTVIPGFDQDEIIGFLSIMALSVEERISRGGIEKLAQELRLRFIRIDHLNLGGPFDVDDIHLLQFFLHDMNTDEKLAFVPNVLTLISLNVNRVSKIMTTACIIEGDSDVYRDSLPWETRLSKKVTLKLGEFITTAFPEKSWQERASQLGTFIRSFELQFLKAIALLSVYSSSPFKTILDEGGMLVTDDIALISGVLDRYGYLLESNLSHQQVESVIRNLKQELDKAAEARNLEEITTYFNQLLIHLDFIKDRYKVVKTDIESIIACLVKLQEFDLVIKITRYILTILEERFELEDSAEVLVETIVKVGQLMLDKPNKDFINAFSQSIIETMRKIQLPYKLNKSIREVVIQTHQTIIFGMNSEKLIELENEWIQILKNNMSEPRVVYLIVDVLIEIGKSFNNLTIWEEALKLGTVLSQMGDDPGLQITVSDTLKNASVYIAKAPIFYQLFEQLIGDKMRERSEAISKLSAAGQQILPILKEKLADENWYSRRNSLMLLDAVGTVAEIELIEGLLKDPVWQVRKEAVKTLGSVCERNWEHESSVLAPKISYPLVQRLRDPNPFVQSEAVKYIGILGLPRTMKFLFTLYESQLETLPVKEPTLIQEIFSAIVKIANTNVNEATQAVEFFTKIIDRREGLFGKSKFKEFKLLAIRMLCQIKAEVASKEIQRLQKTLKGEMKEGLDKVISTPS